MGGGGEKEMKRKGCRVLQYRGNLLLFPSFSTPLEELGDLLGERVGLAAHIWPHLDQIAHCEDQLPGDRLSVSSPGGDSAVFTLLLNNARDCMCMNSLVCFFFLSFFSFRIDRLLQDALAKTNKSTSSSKYGHNSH